MSSIEIKFRDGTTQQFKHEGRAGGSYTKKLELTEGWATVTDEWGKRIAFPADTIESVQEFPQRY